MTQTNKPEWRTIAFFKRVSLQYSKTKFLKRKLYLHSLYFSQNTLMLSEPRRVSAICILFLDFARFVTHAKKSFWSLELFLFLLAPGMAFSREAPNVKKNKKGSGDENGEKYSHSNSNISLLKTLNILMLTFFKDCWI